MPPARRRPVFWLRLSPLPIGLALLIIGVLTSSAPRHELNEFHRATYCRAGAAGDCIHRSVGHVVGRDEETEGGGSNSQTNYFVTVRRANGHRQKFDAGYQAYHSARRGRPVHMETWRGHVTRIRMGHVWRENIPPTSGTFRAWLIGWAGVALIVACVVYFDAALPAIGFAACCGYIGGAVLRTFLDFWGIGWWLGPILAVLAMVAVRLEMQRF